jgi:PAS domain S-box-containing protein
VAAQDQTKQQHRVAKAARQTGLYVSAVILPWAGVYLSVHSASLQRTPLALSFASIAAVTIFGGIGPGLVATVCSALLFDYYVLEPVGHWTLNGDAAIYAVVLLILGCLVTYLCQLPRTIGERLRVANGSLQRQTEALMEAQQGSNSVAWTLDAEAHRIQWAEGGAEVFGHPFAELRAPEFPLCLIVEEDRQRYLNTLERATAGRESFHVEFRVRWPSGEVRWLESRGRPSPTNPAIWRGVTIDVTDRKNAEFALIRSEKLAAIGRLSATVAHEINNPLEAITNLLFLAGMDQQLKPETKGFLEQADREVSRLASIARHTLTFARPKVSTGVSNLADVIDGVVTMFQPTCRSRGGEIRYSGDAGINVVVPPDDLRQILTNILSNACAALPRSHGLIEIEVVSQENGSRSGPDAPAGADALGEKAGHNAVVQIRDNGSGIPPEIVSRVFDPFFTTKEDVGTGIGLWVTRELVHKHGGSVSAQIEGLPEGFRTGFRVELPLAQATSAGSQPVPVSHV